MLSDITQLLAPQGPVVSAVRTRFPNAITIYAFGSQVHGTARPDLDLLDLRTASTAMQYPVVTSHLDGFLSFYPHCVATRGSLV